MSRRTMYQTTYKSNHEDFVQFFLTDFDWDELLGCMKPEDEEWVRALAEKENLGAMACLVYAMNYRFTAWTEDFVDEETGEHVTVPRITPEEGSLFPPEKELMERCESLLCKHRKELDNTALSMITQHLPVTKNTLILLNERVERGDKNAIERLADMYSWGEERVGIYKNKEKAKKLYEKAGVTVEVEEIGF